jgi:hypothetical protein
MTDALQTKAGCIYIICHILRPGGISFATELEHRHYPPDEPINDLFSIFNVTYQGGVHFVIELPTGKQAYDQACSVAAEFNLKLVPGKPYNGVEEFPVNCLADHCFVLETVDHLKIGNILEEANGLIKKYKN